MSKRKAGSARSRPKGNPKREAPKKGKHAGRAKKALLAIFLTVVGVAILAAGGYGIAYVVTDGFGKNSEEIVVSYNGKTYLREAEGLRILSGDELTVQPLGERDPEYHVTVVAKAGMEFEFRIGWERYLWSYMAGKDFTDGFTITKMETGFRVEYGTLKEILGAVYANVDMYNWTYRGEGDLFELVVTSGEQEIRLGFGFKIPVEGIELTPNYFV